MTSRPDLPAFAALLPWEVESSEVEQMEESKVFPQAYATFVYTNPDDDVVIRQKDPMGNDDAYVVIPKHHINRVIAAIRKASKGE